jgi:hypothetical protein
MARKDDDDVEAFIRENPDNTLAAKPERLAAVLDRLVERGALTPDGRGVSYPDVHTLSAAHRAP